MDQPTSQPAITPSDQQETPSGPCLRCILGAVAGSLVAIWMLLMTYRGARGLGRWAARGLRQPDH